MSKAKEGQLSKNFGMTRLRVKRIKGRRFLSHPFSRRAPKKISKVNHPKVSTPTQIYLGKGQENNLYNVGDVREIIYIGTSLTKEKE
jgi:hypothetical protein